MNKYILKVSKKKYRRSKKQVRKSIRSKRKKQNYKKDKIRKRGRRRHSTKKRSTLRGGSNEGGDNKLLNESWKNSSLRAAIIDFTGNRDAEGTLIDSWDKNGTKFGPKKGDTDGDFFIREQATYHDPAAPKHKTQEEIDKHNEKVRRIIESRKVIKEKQERARIIELEKGLNDKELKKGTRVKYKRRLNGDYIEGTYIGFKRNRYGANKHYIRFDIQEEGTDPFPVELRGLLTPLEWNVLSVPMDESGQEIEEPEPEPEPEERNMTQGAYVNPRAARIEVTVRFIPTRKIYKLKLTAFHWHFDGMIDWDTFKLED